MTISCGDKELNGAFILHDGQIRAREQREEEMPEKRKSKLRGGTGVSRNLTTEARDRVWRARGDSVLCEGTPGCLWKSNALSKLRWGLVGEARKSRQAKAVTRRGKTSINNRV